MYGGSFQAHAWTDWASEIKRRVEERIGVEFNSLNLNYYRDGNDYIGMHRAVRRFQVRHYKIPQGNADVKQLEKLKRSLWLTEVSSSCQPDHRANSHMAVPKEEQVGPRAKDQSHGSCLSFAGGREYKEDLAGWNSGSTLHRRGRNTRTRNPRLYRSLNTRPCRSYPRNC